MGLKFSSSWEVAPTIFRITVLGRLFPIMVPNLRIRREFLRPIFIDNNLFVPIHFYSVFFDKVEGESSFLDFFVPIHFSRVLFHKNSFGTQPPAIPPKKSRPCPSNLRQPQLPPLQTDVGWQWFKLFESVCAVKQTLVRVY